FTHICVLDTKDIRHESLAHMRALLSFPTRRSSDLGPPVLPEEPATSVNLRACAAHRPVDRPRSSSSSRRRPGPGLPRCAAQARRDRKSTRLNSSHVSISYAVFCLNKKNKLEDESVT